MSEKYSFQSTKEETYSSSSASSSMPWHFSPSSSSSSSSSSSTTFPSSTFHSNTLFDSFNESVLPLESTSDFPISASGYLKYGLYRLLGLALWSHVTVSTTLLKIQYLPNEATRKKFSGLTQDTESKQNKKGEDEEEKEFEAFEDDDPLHSSPETMVMLDALSSPVQSKFSKHLTPPPTLDTEGYFVYTPFMDETEGTKPPHCLPRLHSTHVWSTMQVIRQHRYEGMLGLYKGLFTDFFKQMLYETIEPSFSSSLCEVFHLDESLEPVDLDNPFPMTCIYFVSRVFVDWLVSPLEYFKARLILRSRKAPFLQSLSMFRDVFPLSYTHPNFLFPTLSVSFVYHGFNLLTPLVIDRGFGISSIYNPYQYALYECLGTITRDLLLLPLTTIQLRLGTQPGDEYSIVDISPIPYTGMWDCFKRMLFEERGKKWKLFRPLYKGFRIALISHVFHFCVRITGEYMDWEAMFEDETF